MAKQSLILSVVVYGLLITTVLGSKNDDDGRSWFAICAVVLAAGGGIICAPVVLVSFGFTSAGAAAGSIAAAIQGPAIASGSVFALAQIAGAAGLAVGTK